MKTATLIFLFLLSALAMQAQKHSLFTDVSIPGISPFGISETYNYKTGKHYGIGAGMQVFNYHPITHRRQFIPSVYADMRFYLRPGKTHQFFTMIDIGGSIYKAGEGYNKKKTKFYNYGQSSLFAGWGFEYLYSVTKNSSGPYAALKLLSNVGITDGYYVETRRPLEILAIDATPVLCVGFKF